MQPPLGLVRVATLTALAAILMAIAAGPAAASHVQCGGVITQDTTLDSDVICEGSSSAVAITVGADNITLDLAGHRIEGRDPSTEDTIGVSSQGVPRSGLTVENGSITGFSRAVWFPAIGPQAALAGGVVRNMTIDGPQPINLGGPGNLVASSHVTGTELPVAVQGRDNRVVGNEIAGVGARQAVTADTNARIVGNMVSLSDPSGPPHGRPPVAIFVIPHDHALVRENVVTSDGDGIAVGFSDGDSETLIEGNTVTDAGGVGISAGSDSLVRKNVVNGNGSGIELSGFSSAIQNTATGNVRMGIHGATSGRIERNVASSNGQYGIVAGFTASVRGNLAEHNGLDGIFAAGESVGDDGSPETFVTVGQNAANYNGGYGIRAIRAIDRGGNRAQGNGNPAQCIGVRCR